MTPTTPRQAREAAELYRDTGTTVSVTMVFSLADQIEKLTKERDALAVNHKECVRCLGEALQDTANASVERGALAVDAARYRWLRSSRHNDATVMTYVDGLDEWVAWADGEDVDFSVDKAMFEAGVQ